MNQISTSGSFSVEDHTFLMFKRSSIKDFIISELEQESDINDKTKREHLIICRFCNTIITSPENIIEINGKHAHIFTNPAGNTFRIGCFSFAKGCLNYGEPTMDHTWFPGYDWCYAICSGCHSHLGWFYQSGTSKFYGLILNNLIENI